MRSELRSRLETLQVQAIRVESLRDQTLRTCQEKSSALDRNRSDTLLLEKVVALFNLMIDQLVHQSTTPITDLVTKGFRAIFQDQDLEFGYDTSIKRDNVSVDFHIRRGSIKGRPLHSSGGGPCTVASLLLRIYIMMKLNKERFLVLDETLKAISPEYIENTATFLRELAEESGLDILLVTHTDKQSYAECASKVLTAYDATPGGELVTMNLREQIKQAHEVTREVAYEATQ